MARHTIEKAKQLMEEYASDVMNDEKAKQFWKYILEAPRKILRELLATAIANWGHYKRLAEAYQKTLQK